jgi:hypothetical protein
MEKKTAQSPKEKMESLYAMCRLRDPKNTAGHLVLHFPEARLLAARPLPTLEHTAQSAA